MTDFHNFMTMLNSRELELQGDLEVSERWKRENEDQQELVVTVGNSSKVIASFDKETGRLEHIMGLGE